MKSGTLQSGGVVGQMCDCICRLAGPVAGVAVVMLTQRWKEAPHAGSHRGTWQQALRCVLSQETPSIPPVHKLLIQKLLRLALKMLPQTQGLKSSDCRLISTADSLSGLTTFGGSRCLHHVPCQFLWLIGLQAKTVLWIPDLVLLDKWGLMAAIALFSTFARMQGRAAFELGCRRNSSCDFRGSSLGQTQECCQRCCAILH